MFFLAIHCGGQAQVRYAGGHASPIPISIHLTPASQDLILSGFYLFVTLSI